MLWGRQTWRWFPSGCILTHPMFALCSCTPLQKTGEGFEEHHLDLAELVPLPELFPGPFFSPQTYCILPIISKGICFEEDLADQSFTPAQSWTRANNTWQEKRPKYKETNCATCSFCLSVFSVCYEWCIVSNSCVLCIAETTKWGTACIFCANFNRGRFSILQTLWLRASWQQ